MLRFIKLEAKNNDSLMKDSFFIGEWKIEPEINTISKSGKSHRLEPKIMQVLLMLAEKNGEVVKKDDLLNTVWANTIVVDMVLIRAISELRSIFKDKRTSPKYIETVSKAGYRLIAPIDKKQKTLILQKHKQKTFIITIVAITLGLLLYLFLPKNQQPQLGVVNIRIPHALTTEKGWEYHPDVSPDQKKVAFVAQGNSPSTNISILNLESKQTTTISPKKGLFFRPIWISNETIACYTRQGNEVSICLLEGNKKPNILFKVNANYTGLSYSKQRNELAYLSKDPSNKHAIFLYSIQNKTNTQLTFPDDAIWGDSGPAYDKDDKYLAFIRSVSEGNQDIYIIDLESKEVIRQTQLNSNIYGLDWINNNTIIFSSNKNGIDELWELKISNIEPGKIRPYGWGLNVHNPKSLNGKIIGEKWQTDTDLHTIKRDKDNKWIFSTPDSLSSTLWDLHPTMSINGTIAFTSNRSGSYELWIKEKHKSAQQISSYGSGFNGKARWSKNGQNLLFNTNQSGKSTISLYNIKNKNIVPVIKDNSQNINPSWGTNDDYFFYCSDKSGKWNIWKYSFSDNASFQITKDGGYFGQEAPFNNQLYYTKPTEEGIWKLDFKNINSSSEKVIQNLSATDWGNWGFYKEGIYFVTNIQNNTTLVSFDFSTNKIKSIYNFEKPLPANDPGVFMNYEGNIIIYGQTKNYNGDLVLFD